MAIKKIYVGNLPFSATEDEINRLFSEHGTVESVSVVSDRETGQPRGFAFVEMPDAAADEAIRALDGAALGGRNLRVNEARPREAGGGGGRGGGGGYRGGAGGAGGGGGRRW